MRVDTTPPPGGLPAPWRLSPLFESRAVSAARPGGGAVGGARCGCATGMVITRWPVVCERCATLREVHTCKHWHAGVSSRAAVGMCRPWLQPSQRGRTERSKRTRW